MVRSISKNRIIRTIFTNLAPYYDALEPWLTWGRGEAWRRRAVAAAKQQSPRRILDACSGTGLLTLPLAQAYGARCHIVAIDFCPAMAVQAKQRLQNANLHRRVETKVENIEIMPFPDGFFDAVFISFGLRLVSDIRVVLKEVHRVLRPGGRFVILELARPGNFIMRAAAYLAREFFLPAYGRLRHRLPSQLIYPLHDSLWHYPDPEKLGRMLMRTNFDEVEYKWLGGGVATLHVAAKPEVEQLRFENVPPVGQWSEFEG
jgi:demethylmenaquinone methyltransferase / 2-methoxy-6-polyprenyl-1,4-benzoquinol methylase